MTELSSAEMFWDGYSWNSEKSSADQVNFY